MSIITKFYEEYVEHEDVTEAKAINIDCLRNNRLELESLLRDVNTLLYAADLCGGGTDPESLEHFFGLFYMAKDKFTEFKDEFYEVCTLKRQGEKETVSEYTEPVNSEAEKAFTAGFMKALEFLSEVLA